jgi:hypothetical protein
MTKEESQKGEARRLLHRLSRAPSIEVLLRWLGSRSACPKVNREFELQGRWCQLPLRGKSEKESYSAREPARKVKTKEVVRNKSLIRLVVSFPGWMFHILMPFNCSAVLFQNPWSGSRE